MTTKAARQEAGRSARSRQRKAGVQYTIRNVPPQVDAVLRRRARQEGQSLNELLRAALAREAGLSGEVDRLHHDLDAISGTWEDDPQFDAAVADQDRVDPDLWR